MAAASAFVIGLVLLLALPAAAAAPVSRPATTSRRQEMILRAFSPPGGRALPVTGAIVASMIVAALVGPLHLIQTVVGNGLARVAEVSDTTIRHLIENRHGIVHTLVDDRRGDIVFGDGVYDGRINLDLRTNANRIDRAWAAAAIKHDAKRVLVIGLSGGAWTRLLQDLPALERIDAVEINPGYVELIARYPAGAAAAGRSAHRRARR